MRAGIGRRGLLGLGLGLSFVAPAALAQMGPGSGPYGKGPGGSGPGGMGPGGRGPGGMMGGGMMGGGWNTPRYLDALKARLGITDAEEPAWKVYADTVGGVAEQMQGLHQTVFEAMGTATWEERQQMMNNMFQARQQAANTVHDAATTLLPALTPAQRTIAQSTLPGLAYGRGMMR